jgi:hypothetical protein
MSCSCTDRLAVAAASVALALLASCSTPASSVMRPAPAPLAAGGAAGRSSPIQGKLVDKAHGFVGATRIVVGQRTFAPDCTGLVLAIYYSAGLDLEKVFPRYRGNGVERLHAAMRDGGLLHRDPAPGAADLIFWDNTYDENEDGRWNDQFTHVGMVMESERGGTVTYIHYNYRRGVVLEHMNLARPSVMSERGPGGAVIPLNSPMRMAGTFRPGDPTLAGELFHDFGRAYRLPL